MGQEDSNVRLGTAVIFVDSGWEKVRSLEDESSPLGPGVLIGPWVGVVDGDIASTAGLR